MMSQPKGDRKHRRYHHNKKINIGDKGKEIVESINENNLVVQQFRGYATELDDKHDRFERIVKISRDITIESKRIIFLLHTIDKQSKQESVLQEAKTRLQNVAQNLFSCIALELENQDPYQYLKAYRAGLEEYIEAITFYQYMHGGDIEHWTELEKILTYTNSEKSEYKTLRTLVTPYEYILGIADLTGELMRKCINDLATGDIGSCYQTCSFVRNMYKGFLGSTSISNKEMNRKLCTLKQSIHKMENVCYTIKVRGSEIPKHILVDVATEEYAESDEGYQVY
ncbi:translin-associated protein X [Hylaeus anthracinus]|uniref:translin-associated protein X n=1 Tax=Hylaeus volcanicus TaxID=313075 RepID=UPI0023B80A1B|nr:translin-associated protein X [Hylaeus volcanicus]XP_054012081.1 translin-associated protein X [Hylaeus anthracinus]